MKKLTFALLLTLLATPAKAVEIQDATYIGEVFGENVCMAIDSGASSQDEAIEMGIEMSIDKLPEARVAELLEIIEIVEEHGDEHEVSAAYLEGYAEGVVPCWSAYNELP